LLCEDTPYVLKAVCRTCSFILYFVICEVVCQSEYCSDVTYYMCLYHSIHPFQTSDLIDSRLAGRLELARPGA
jgi:hypothetical protein